MFVFAFIAAFLICCTGQKKGEVSAEPEKDDDVETGFAEEKEDAIERAREESEEAISAIAEAASALKKVDQNYKKSESVACSGEILEYDPEYFFCDHDYVPEGSPSSMGRYPLITARLISPKEHQDREVNILFRSTEFSMKGVAVGRMCEFKLPGDFLAGDYGMIYDWSIESFRALDKKGSVD